MKAQHSGITDYEVRTPARCEKRSLGESNGV